MRRRLAVTAAIWIVGAAVLRVTLAQPERCPEVDVSGDRDPVGEAIGWIQRALLPDDRYVYEFDEDGGRRSGEYNEVRHAGVTMSLYQVAVDQLPDTRDDLLETADRALTYMQRNLVRRHDWAAFTTTDTNPRLGATALMLAGLAQRRLATNDDEYDDLMQELAAYVLAMQRGDGQFFEEYDLDDDAPVPDQYSRYFTGEAFWSLALLHRLFPDEGWDEPARRTARYLATERDDEDDFPFPPWPDQWAAYGLAEMAAWPGDEPALGEPELDYARRLAARFGLVIRTESKRREGGLTELVLYRPARAAGMGTWVEGATSLYRVAAADDRLADLRDDLAERVECGVGMLIDRQRRSGDELVRGAWFTDGSTRMDDQQHALSALHYGLSVVAPEEPE